MANHDLELNEIDVFHYEEGSINFNDLCFENGFTYWFARDYLVMLGYQNYNGFKKPINKAISTCMTLDIDVTDNFEQINRIIDGQSVKDYKLSRFACYLIAMNADGKKLEVAKAQAFFAAAAETIRRYVSDASQLDRVLVRDEISIHEKTLSGVAKKAGVDQYALFQNAGYRGMYNMNLRNLKKYKDIPLEKRSLLDYMGKDELAANLFRLTQTELKMRNEDITGQRNAENAAEHVGRKIRKTMIEIGGIAPEDMELEEDIRKIRTSLKHTHKGLKKIDN